MSWTRRALVTGGAGFIGSELVAQLVGDGWWVRVLDNLANGSAQNLSGLLDSRCELVEADVRDLDRVRRALEGIDVVYHLACLGVRHSIHSPVENHDVNATATLRLLDLSRAVGVPRFVAVSTSEVYGTARHAPMGEDHPTYPETVYGSSKLAGDCYARAFHRTWGYPTVVVRPFNSFGPRSHHEGDSGEVIPKFVLRSMAGLPMVAFGDGLQTRDFTYVTDTARGILKAGVADAAVGETLNLGSGSEVSIRDLAALVADAVGLDAPRLEHQDARPGDVRRLCADVTRAGELLGFRPTVSLRDGLRSLVSWYRELGSDPRELLAAETVRNWEPGEAGS